MILSTLASKGGSLIGHVLNELNGSLKPDKAAEKAEKKAEKAEDKAEKKGPKNGGGTPAPIDSAVRFDLPVPPLLAAAPVPGVAPDVGVVASSVAVPIAPSVTRTGSPPVPAPVADSIQEVTGGSNDGRSAGVATDPASGTPPQAGTAAPVYRAAILDDEAMARASALRSIARENTLSLVDRIARATDAPAAGETAKDSRFAQPPAEPKTLAVA